MKKIAITRILFIIVSVFTLAVTFKLLLFFTDRSGVPSIKTILSILQNIPPFLLSLSPFLLLFLLPIIWLFLPTKLSRKISPGMVNYLFLILMLLTFLFCILFLLGVYANLATGHLGISGQAFYSVIVALILGAILFRIFIDKIKQSRKALKEIKEGESTNLGG